MPPPSSGGGANRSVLIGLVTLIVVLLGVGAFVLLSGDDDETATESTSTTVDEGEDPDEDATTTTTEADATTTTTAEPTTPDSQHISSGGLTYERLPEPWEDWAASGQQPIPEISGTAGQFVVVQEQAPSGGQWISNLLIGDLANTFDYTGEADLPAVTNALSTQLIGTYYVDGAASEIVQQTGVTIDGHPGYFIHNEVTFTQTGLETTREKVVVVVIDTGRARPGVFWASIPYNRIDLNDGMDTVYRTLQVND